MESVLLEDETNMIETCASTDTSSFPIYLGDIDETTSKEGLTGLIVQVEDPTSNMGISDDEEVDALVDYPAAAIVSPDLLQDPPTWKVESPPSHDSIPPVVSHGPCGVDTTIDLDELMDQALKAQGIGTDAANEAPLIEDDDDQEKEAIGHDDTVIVPNTIESINKTTDEDALMKLDNDVTSAIEEADNKLSENVDSRDCKVETLRAPDEDVFQLASDENISTLKTDAASPEMDRVVPGSDPEANDLRECGNVSENVVTPDRNDDVETLRTTDEALDDQPISLSGENIPTLSDAASSEIDDAVALADMEPECAEVHNDAPLIEAEGDDEFYEIEVEDENSCDQGSEVEIEDDDEYEEIEIEEEYYDEEVEAEAEDEFAEIKVDIECDDEISIEGEGNREIEEENHCTEIEFELEGNSFEGPAAGTKEANVSESETPTIANVISTSQDIPNTRATEAHDQSTPKDNKPLLEDSKSETCDAIEALDQMASEAEKELEALLSDDGLIDDEPKPITPARAPEKNRAKATAKPKKPSSRLSKTRKEIPHRTPPIRHWTPPQQTSFLPSNTNACKTTPQRTIREPIYKNFRPTVPVPFRLRTEERFLMRNCPCCAHKRKPSPTSVVVCATTSPQKSTPRARSPVKPLRLTKKY